MALSLEVSSLEFSFSGGLWDAGRWDLLITVWEMSMAVDFPSASEPLLRIFSP
jgi:hypothetical protein